MKDNHPTVGTKEVPLVTCTAAVSKPPAEVKWITGSLAKKVEVTTNFTTHDNGTTTTVSSLLGIPTREINNHLVQCVITNTALSKEVILDFSMQIYCEYKMTSIHSALSAVNSKVREAFVCTH